MKRFEWNIVNGLGNMGIIEQLFGKARLGTRALDDLLDHILHFIPVTGIDAVNVAGKVFLDLSKHFPLSTAGDERNSHTDAAESTSTTNAVKIGLVIWLLCTRARSEVCGDILQYCQQYDPWINSCVISLHS